MQLCRRVLILGVLACAAAFGILAYQLPMAGLVLGAVGLAILIGAKKKVQQLDTLGSARWATTDELESAGMLAGRPGLILGRVWAPKPRLPAAIRCLFDKRVSHRRACEDFLKSLQKKSSDTALVTLSKACHVLVVAQTGAGKGQSIVLPFLASSPGSSVVIDPKGENYRETADFRRKRFNHRVVKIDPFGVCGPGSDTFNPLDAIRKDSPLLIDEAAALANAIVARTGDEKDPFWNNSAELWIKAMIVAIALWGDKDRSLQAVRTLLTDPGKRAAIIKVMCESTALGGMVARLGNQLCNFKEKELGSVLSVVSTFMTFLDTPSVAANTQQNSSFDPGDLREGKLTIYLVLPPEHMETQAPLMRLWIGSLLKAVVRGGLQEKNKVTFVLDEAKTLGRMNALKEALYLYRGFGVRLQLIFQDLSQLKTCWGEGEDQSVLANCSQIFFAINDYATAEYVSNRLGESTIVVESGGTNRGGSRQTNNSDPNTSMGTNWGSNANWGLQARKLLKPEELMTLPQRTAITFTPELPPIISWLTRHYEGEPQASSQWNSTARIWAAALGFLALSVAAAVVMAVQMAPMR